MYECTILNLEEMPGLKRRMLLREIHGNTTWGRGGTFIAGECIKSVVTIEWLLILFEKYIIKIAERQIQLSFETIAEKGVPSAFLELDKYSQVSLAIKSALKRKLSTTVQPHDKVSWVSESAYHMPITGGSCGSCIDLVSIDGLAAVEYGKTTDAMLKFCVRRGLFSSILSNVVPWGFGKKDVQTTCQMNALSVLVSATAALSL